MIILVQKSEFVFQGHVSFRAYHCRALCESSDQLLSHSNTSGEQRIQPQLSGTSIPIMGKLDIFWLLFDEPFHISGRTHQVIPLRSLWSVCFWFPVSWLWHMFHVVPGGLKWAEMWPDSITLPYICPATLIPLSSSICFIVLRKKCLPSD